MLEWIFRGLSKGQITIRYPFEPEPELETAFARPGFSGLRERAGMLGRSIHVRHIDCGSDGSEEWEIQALWNPYYDVQRLGFFLTSAPRHADVLLATGVVTDPMRAPLERTWAVMPEPKALIAVGSDACDGVDKVLPVDVYVPGSPPPPIAILHGLLVATGRAEPAEASQWR